MKKGKTNQFIRKWVNVSRITRFLVLLMIVGTPNGFANSYAQHKQFSLRLQDVTIEEFFAEIEKNSEYVFFYNKEVIKEKEKVSIRIENATLPNILDKTLRPKNLDYTIRDRQVIVTAHEEKAQQPRIQVSGVIVDEEEMALIGVTVVEKGTTNGTATGPNGAFTLNVAGPDAVLVFSYVGFTTQEARVGEQRSFTIMLKEDVSTIGEVVVTAPLGVPRQSKAVGYAVSSITSKQLTEAGTTNFASAMYGKAAGVKITTAPGGSSSAVNVQIRGINSLNYNQQPLYVVDGIMIRNDGQNGAKGANNNNYWDDQRIRGNGALDINPSDIETLTILKGASATALYGSDASSGVVVITTKKGAKKEGLGIDLNYNFAIDRVAYTPKFQNTYGPGYDRETNLANGANEEGWIVDSNSPTGYRPYFRSYGQFGPKMEGQDVMWWDGEIRSYSAQPDNYKDVYQTGYSSNANIAISNQTEKLNYRLSYTRLDYRSTQRGSKQAKNTFNLNSSIKLHKRLNADVVVNYINTETKNRPYLLGQVLGSYGGYFSRAEDMSLMLDKYKTSDGYKYVTYDHPERSSEAFIYNIRATNLLDFFWQQLRNEYNENENRLMSSFTLNWDITDHFKVRGRVGNDYTGINIENKQYNEYPVAFNSGKSTGEYSVSKGIYSVLYTDALLTYANKIGNDFGYSISAGIQSRNEKYNDQFSRTDQGLITENWFSLNNSYGIINNSTTGDYPKTRRQELLKYAYLGIINLSYRDYLFLEATARQEYASSLPPGNNHYFYPSVNASFIFSDAFSMPLFLSYGKVRASFGVVGNAPPIYEANILYSQEPLQTSNGSVPSLKVSGNYGNNSLKPEMKYETEVGLELRFLNDRLGFDFSYYTSTMKDQIALLETAASVGANKQLVNAGEIASNGLEFALNGTPVRGQLTWMSRFNIAFSTSKVNSLAEGIPQLTFYDSEQSAVKVVAKPGDKLGDIYVYQRATDGNGNFLINDNGLYIMDKSQHVKVGNIMPKAVGGFSNTLAYKGLALDFTIDYRFGGQMVSNPTKYMMSAGMLEETMDYRDAGNGGMTYSENGKTYHDGLILQGVNESGQVNDKIINAAYYYSNVYGWGEDAWHEEASVYDNSFIKLREVVLSYRIPSAVSRKVGLDNVKVSLFGRNLFYFWKTLKNLDPEAPVGNSWWSQGVDVGSTAATRTFGVSLSASF